MLCVRNSVGKYPKKYKKKIIEVYNFSFFLYFLAKICPDNQLNLSPPYFYLNSIFFNTVYVAPSLWLKLLSENNNVTPKRNFEKASNECSFHHFCTSGINTYLIKKKP